MRVITCQYVKEKRSSTSVDTGLETAQRPSGDPFIRWLSGSSALLFIQVKPLPLTGEIYVTVLQQCVAQFQPIPQQLVDSD